MSSSRPITAFRSKSTYDISMLIDTATIKDTVLPGAVPDSASPPSISRWSSAVTMNDVTQNEQTSRRTSTTNQEMTLQSRPPSQRRSSVADVKRRRSSIKDDLKDSLSRLWARRSSLSLFRSSSKLDVRPMAEEQPLVKEDEHSSCDSLYDEDDGVPAFFIVDRSLLPKQEKRRSSLNIFKF